MYDFYSHDPSVVLGEWATGAYPSGAAFSPNSRYALLTNRFEMQLFSVATHVLIESFATSGCSYADLRKLGVSLDSRFLFGITSCGFDSEASVVSFYAYDTSM